MKNIRFLYYLHQKETEEVSSAREKEQFLYFVLCHRIALNCYFCFCNTQLNWKEIYKFLKIISPAFKNQTFNGKTYVTNVPDIICV